MRKADILEVVELFALDDAAHELLAVEVLARAESHTVHVVLPAVSVELWGRVRS